MKRTITKADAMSSLKPGAEFSIQGEDYSTINWVDTKQTKPSESDINAEVTRLQAIEDYQGPRRSEYPALREQLDLLYKDILAGKVDSTGEFAKAIKAVKDKYPKS